MSRLIRLYPPAWRERYVDEFRDLLEARPATWRDRIDIARGALDAWVHPQVRRPGRAPAPDGRPLRLSVLVPATIGGLLLILGGLVIAVAPFSAAFGYRESGWGTAAIVLGLIAVGLSAVAIARSTPLDPARSRWAARAMLAGGVITLASWPLLIVGFFLHIFAALAFGATAWLSGRRVLGAAIVGAGLLLPNFNTEDARALFLIPVGVLWIMAGIIAATQRPAHAPGPGVIVSVPAPASTGVD